jgi:hydrogenase expression/formation protein HypC
MAEVPPECSGPVCITCSDAAVPVTVLELRPDGMALVDTGAGPPEEISVALVDARPGTVLLVHAGEAIGHAAPTRPGPRYPGLPMPGDG